MIPGLRLGPAIAGLSLLTACAGPAEGHHEDEGAAHAGHGDAVVLGATPLGAETIVPAPITLDPRGEARVAAVTGGTLERILARPGDLVGAGGSLATVLSAELGTAIGGHLSATARLGTARARRERIETLPDGGLSSLAEVAQAEADYTVAAADAEAAEERLRVFGGVAGALPPQRGGSLLVPLRREEPDRRGGAVEGRLAPFVGRLG